MAVQGYGGEAGGNGEGVLDGRVVERASERGHEVTSMQRKVDTAWREEEEGSAGGFILVRDTTITG